MDEEEIKYMIDQDLELTIRQCEISIDDSGDKFKCKLYRTSDVAEFYRTKRH